MHLRSSRMLTFIMTLMLAISLAACGQPAAGDTAAPGNEAQRQNADAASGNDGGNAAAEDGSGAQAGDASITVEDAQGTVTLAKRPERIVAMDFSFTDMLLALGVQPVGIADDGDPELFMDAVKELLQDYTSVGSRYEPSIELISSLQPDLIIVDINKHKNALPQLKELAPLLVLDDYQADYEQMLVNFSIVAKAVGKEAEGAQRLQEHQAKIEEAQRQIQDTNLTVLPAVVNPTGFFGHSDHSYSGSMIKLLGFTDPLLNDNAYPELTLEQLVETNPQALFLMPTADVTIVDEWQTNPLWNEIDAVASGRVYTVERRDWSLSRGMLGSEKIADDILKQLGA